MRTQKEEKKKRYKKKFLFLTNKKIILLIFIILLMLLGAAILLSSKIIPLLSPANIIQKTGYLGTTFIEDFDIGYSEKLYSLTVDEDNKSYDLVFLEENLPLTLGLESGDFISISGTLEGDSIIVDSAAIIEKDKGAIAAVLPREIKTIVLLVNALEEPDNKPFTVEEARFEIFDESNPESLTIYYKELSYGKVNITGEVKGWYNISSFFSICGRSQFYDFAALAAANDVDFRNFERLILLYPNYSNCFGRDGRADTGRFISGVRLDAMQQRLSNDNFSEPRSRLVMRHESGHNFDVEHANGWECGSEIISRTCQSYEYYDEFDVMGMFNLTRSNIHGNPHFNAIHKEKVGWLTSINILDVQGMLPNTFQIANVEEYQDTYPIAIKYPRKNITGLVEDNYYLEYRRNVGFDSLLGNIEGILIHINKTLPTSDSQILDMSPHVSSTDEERIQDFLDVVLRVNQSYWDDYSDFYVEVVSINDIFANVYISDRQPLCGNGFIEPREECDDNNNLDGDGCSVVCQKEPCTYTLSLNQNITVNGKRIQLTGISLDEIIVVSVNGILSPAIWEGRAVEVQGLKITNVDTVPSITDSGYAEIAVTSAVAGEVASCGPVCGNNVLEINEICELGQVHFCTVPFYNYDGIRRCNADCSGFGVCEPMEYCGDGILNGYEGCDDGNTVSGDGCSSSCGIEGEGGGGSFLPGTQIIMANGLTKNIENMKIGEFVLSYDLNKREFVNGEVIASLSHIMPEYYEINDNLGITSTNPILVNGEWKFPSELKIGDSLLTSSGNTERVKRIEYVKGIVQVYNLQINTGTYFAGGIAIHNQNVSDIVGYAIATK